MVYFYRRVSMGKNAARKKAQAQIAQVTVMIPPRAHEEGQPTRMEVIETDSEATSELDNTEQLLITEDTNLETTTDHASWDNQPTTVQINLEASRVKIVYKFVRQLTGTLGSDGSGGPINGELRVGCMQKIIAFLVAFCSLTSSSRFVDIGSGQGKPSFHVAQSPGVRLSIGVEVERLRWMVI